MARSGIVVLMYHELEGYCQERDWEMARRSGNHLPDKIPES
jgi:hypothetical protein